MAYEKSLEDEIDWKIIDQLHTVTLNFSNRSLELKKLLFVLVGIAVPSLIKLAGDRLDASLFVTIYLFTFTFWYLDSYTYFYQEKLRAKMDIHFRQIKARNEKVLVLVDIKREDFTLDKSRTSVNRIRRSIINSSVVIYIFVAVLNSTAFILYLTGIIK